MPRGQTAQCTSHHMHNQRPARLPASKPYLAKRQPARKASELKGKRRGEAHLAKEEKDGHHLTQAQAWRVYCECNASLVAVIAKDERQSASQPKHATGTTVRVAIILRRRVV